MRASAWFAPFFSTKFFLKIKQLHRFSDARAWLRRVPARNLAVVEFLPCVKDQRARA